MTRLFWQGRQEALALRAESIDFEVIPGVSSSYAVAAYNGIPVTHRGLASSFHVITGHEDAKKSESVLDYETLAKEEGTLVFLMGLKNLLNITQNLMAFGKAEYACGSDAGGNDGAPENRCRNA